jgi:hypothetical protein
MVPRATRYKKIIKKKSNNPLVLVENTTAHKKRSAGQATYITANDQNIKG